MKITRQQKTIIKDTIEMYLPVLNDLNQSEINQCRLILVNSLAIEFGVTTFDFELVMEVTNVMKANGIDC